MSDIIVSSVVGVDGHSPIYNPSEAWRIWNRDEIYWGPTFPGQNKYVPKINDYIKDISTGVDYRVTDLDPTTFIPTMIKAASANDDGMFEPEDLLIGVGPGTPSETWRIYIDKTVVPHTLSVERRCYVPGADTRSAMIFKGGDFSSPQSAISAYYDTQGNLLGQSIPLELVAIDNSKGQNVSCKIIPTCYTMEDLKDGDVVTAFVYSDTGIVVWKRQFIVEETSFVAGPTDAAKYVTDIYLKSPFLSSSDATLLKYPINVLVGSLDLIGVVKYSDNSTLEMPVDGTKFSFDGLESYVATIVGQKVPCQLVYTLSPGEIAYTNVGIGNERFIEKQYYAQTDEVKGAYSAKLFAYPVWIDAINGYRLEWWLANLDRTAIFRATQHVRLNGNVAAFDPLLYGTTQRLSVSVDLFDVQPSLGHWTHTQTLDVVLLSPGTNHSGNGNWTVGFDPGQTPPFGVQNAAKTTFINSNLYQLQIDMGETDQTAWLNRMFFRARPLFNPARESVAPAPTHFALVFSNQTIEFPIAEWNMMHPISHPIPNSSTLFIKFFKRTADNDIELAMIGVPVYQQN